jgi:hypothetical protein
MRSSRGDGRSRKRATQGYLGQPGNDEGQKHQPPDGAAHNEWYRIVNFIRLYFGLCLEEEEENRNASQETDSRFLNMSPLGPVHSPNPVTSTSLCPPPQPTPLPHLRDNVTKPASLLPPGVPWCLRRYLGLHKCPLTLKQGKRRTVKQDLRCAH